MIATGTFLCAYTHNILPRNPTFKSKSIAGPPLPCGCNLVAPLGALFCVRQQVRANKIFEM